MYFSDFPGEKECLFIAGIPIMTISNIINVSEQNLNYREYVQAINIINSVFKGTYDYHNQDEEISKFGQGHYSTKSHKIFASLACVFQGGICLEKQRPNI